MGSIPFRNRSLAVLSLIALLWPAAQVRSQAAPQAPLQLEGSWQGDGWSRGWSLQVEKVEPDGKFSGRLDFTGITCSTQGLAVNGVWANGELNFKARFSVRCGEWAFSLRNGTKHRLEGQIGGTPLGEIQAWLDG
jgi:hypothetical protein